MDANDDSKIVGRGWDIQTFDNLVDNVCNATETYLSLNCKGVRQIVEGKIDLQERV